MQYNFLSKLGLGTLLVGSGISLPAPELIEIYGDLGYDWVFIDTEHTPMEAQSVQHLLQSLPLGCSGLIRISDQHETTIKKALDMGPDGIIVPQVNTAEQAQQVVAYARYEPLGQRGVGVSRANDYGQSLASYLERANTNQALILQAEHYIAVQNIEQILQVQGFDAILVGPFDLSASMGKPGQVNDPDVKAAIENVGRACREKGFPCGLFGASAAFLKHYVDMGFSFVVAGMDVLHLAQTAKKELQLLKTLKRHV